MPPNEEFFEGSMIELDSGTLVASAGWTLNYAAVERVGSLVAVHIEATNAVSAAAAVATLPKDYAPDATVTNDAGTFALSSVGALTFPGSTGSAVKRICTLVFRAGQVSPE